MPHPPLRRCHLESLTANRRGLVALQKATVVLMTMMIQVYLATRTLEAAAFSLPSHLRHVQVATAYKGQERQGIISQFNLMSRAPGWGIFELTMIFFVAHHLCYM